MTGEEIIEKYESYLEEHEIGYHWLLSSFFVHIPLNTDHSIAIEYVEGTQEFSVFDLCVDLPSETAEKILQVMTNKHTEYDFGMYDTDDGVDVGAEKGFLFTTIEDLHQHVLDLAKIMDEMNALISSSQG